MKTKKITVMAMMICFISVCSWITVPYVVPFTMQTFSVFCTILLLGGKISTAAVALYILLGCIGLPVFSGFSGGIGHLLGPTGGYIVGFIFIPLCYLVFESLMINKKKFRLPVLILGTALCYLAGTIWFFAVTNLHGNKYGFLSVLSMCVLPYIIPDLLKMLLALLICDRVKKVIPVFYHNTDICTDNKTKSNDENKI